MPGRFGQLVVDGGSLVGSKPSVDEIVGECELEPAHGMIGRIALVFRLHLGGAFGLVQLHGRDHRTGQVLCPRLVVFHEAPKRLQREHVPIEGRKLVGGAVDQSPVDLRGRGMAIVRHALRAWHAEAEQRHRPVQSAETAFPHVVPGIVGLVVIAPLHHLGPTEHVIPGDLATAGFLKPLADLRQIVGCESNPRMDARRGHLGTGRTPRSSNSTRRGPKSFRRNWLQGISMGLPSLLGDEYERHVLPPKGDLSTIGSAARHAAALRIVIAAWQKTRKRQLVDRLITRPPRSQRGTRPRENDALAHRDTRDYRTTPLPRQRTGTPG